MARLYYHEHPGQRGRCLPGAFDAYARRIPVDGYRDLDQVWAAIRSRPFESDEGTPGDGRAVGAQESPGECRPRQRSRVWPARMNCWEESAHFVAGALRFLGPEWQVHVWDRDLPNGARHVWPSLVSKAGDHFIVDLRPKGVTDGPRAAARRRANEWYNDLFGGVHVVGGTVLKVFGQDKLVQKLEDIEGDALPEWARMSSPSAEPGEGSPKVVTGGEERTRKATHKRRDAGLGDEDLEI